MKVLITIILFYTVHPIAACVAHAAGVDTPYNELIDTSKTILLVKVERKTKKMKIIEVLKGDAHLKDLYLGIRGEVFGGGTGVYSPSDISYHYQNESFENDFNQHKDPTFWKEYEGRGYFPCCVCSPFHIFKAGSTYLVFPDIWNNRKAAELIKSPDDKWYTYVKEKVRKGKASF
ncbi:MAG: hypothetical protein AAF518_25510 [Spirochaetota bacterium]